MSPTVFSPLYRVLFFTSLLTFTAILAACVSTPAALTPTVLVSPPTATVFSSTGTPEPSPSSTAGSPVSMATSTPDGNGFEDVPYYYGGLVITLDDVGGTLTMPPGEAFLLRLGGDYQWQVAFDPEGIVGQNRRMTAAPGEQGVYVAREKGRTVLAATGTPICAALQPPCARPSVLFQMVIIVE